MAKDNKIYKFFIVIMLVICCISLLLAVTNNTLAFANTSEYTSVLDDLSKDSTFAVYRYPDISNNYSLNFINLAESVNKELFVYIYNPSANMVASSINLSCTNNNSLQINNYKLKLIDSQGTLSKYLVEGFTVLNDSQRFYNIISLFRPFNADIDIKPDNGNITNEVSYKVGKEFCIYDDNGVTKTVTHDIETITVTDKFVGFCRYNDGFRLNPSACDSHFVAFDTDKKIDNLFEADVFYTSQACNYHCTKFGQESYNFGNKQDKKITLSYTDKVEHTGKGLFSSTYTWNRIENVDNFIKNENIKQNVYTGATIDVKTANKITDDGLNKLKNKKWILRFTETEITSSMYDGAVSRTSTNIGDVTLLRLKFETNGELFNLGVIDNKTTQDSNEPPINDEETTVEPLTPEQIMARFWERLSMFFKEWWWVFVIVIAVIILLLHPEIIFYLLKLVWKIITLPVVICRWIYRKIKSKELTKNNDVQLLKNSDKACLHTKTVNVSAGKKKRGKK